MCVLFIITYFFSLPDILSILAERRWKLRRYLNIVNAEDTAKWLEISQHSWDTIYYVHVLHKEGTTVKHHPLPPQRTTLLEEKLVYVCNMQQYLYSIYVFDWPGQFDSILLMMHLNRNKYSLFL